MKPLLAIIGCGTVGTAIGRLLARAGYEVAGVATRSQETATRAAKLVGAKRFSDSPWEVSKEAQAVLITTPDDVLQSVCEAISKHDGFGKEAVVIHCSGALPSEILSSAREGGARVASLHPLQAFASAEQAEQLLPGSFFAVEGDEEALPLVHQLVKDLGGILMEISPEGKTLYHAAAVTASNYLVTLMDLALKLNGSTGLPWDVSLQALLPLVKGTLKNIERAGIAGALTGPVSRGDVHTVGRHLAAIEKYTPELLLVNKTLGLHTVDIAKEKGTLTQEAAGRLEALFGPGNGGDKAEEGG